MKRLLTLIKYLRSYFPEKLPVGLTAYNQFTDSIIELAGPYADKDSMRFAISTMIIHLSQDHGSVSKQLFVRRLRKVAANQVASAVINDIKQRQAEEIAKKQAEATATQDLKVVANGEKTQP
jgi:hypothetical protein